MTEQDQHDLNQDYDKKITNKYKSKIINDILEIGDYGKETLDITNLMFLEKFNILTLKIYTTRMILKMKNTAIRKLTLVKPWTIIEQQLNLNIDDLELENLEVLLLGDIQLKNDQLYNLSKFKKLKILDVSRNYVDLIHIHNVQSLTKLDMQYCCLINIELIYALVNLQDLNLNSNPKIDIIPVYKVKGLIKLSIYECQLKQIDQIAQLTNLEVLNISYNQLKNINPISQLINLKELSIRQNYQIDITPLNTLVGLIKLDILDCKLVSICDHQQIQNSSYLVQLNSVCR
ncbi:Leucine_Rich Repeat domain protein [Hexamita inflata]|uniref:Leucine Rich Repeat domain protein n=1 Tax=Hexamita inflata TaxID=28002 RepID=A0AA86NU31_9EUKA|nr:Leucine Rich Repeat domain protein [Hexamita inflata]CAI9966735.1 Leucine Rich Repeat domain protein [Hexamita inflata]